MFEMQVKGAVSVKPYSAIPGEDECLLLPGVCFVVRGMRADNVQSERAILLQEVEKKEPAYNRLVTASAALALPPVGDSD